MDTLLIAGAWRPAHDARTRTIRCLADGREVVTVAEASEVNDALQAAQCSRLAEGRGSLGILAFEVASLSECTR